MVKPPDQCLRPRLTTSLILAPSARTTPGRRLCLMTTPFLRLREKTRFTLPVRQWFLAIAAFAVASRLPTTFGTVQCLGRHRRGRRGRRRHGETPDRERLRHVRCGCVVRVAGLRRGHRARPSANMWTVAPLMVHGPAAV